MSEKFQNINIFPLKKEHPSIKANGSVLVSGIVQVNFAIRHGSNGLFASLPGHFSNQTDENGKKKWYSDVYLPDEAVRAEFQKAMVAAYQQKVNQAPPQGDNTNAGEHNQDNEYNDGIPF